MNAADEDGRHHAVISDVDSKWDPVGWLRCDAADALDKTGCYSRSVYAGSLDLRSRNTGRPVGLLQKCHASLVHGSAGVQEDANGNLFPPPEQVAATGPAAVPAAVSAANEDYKRAVADYRNCLAANPKNVNACEGQRHIMDADAQVLSGSSQGPR